MNILYLDFETYYDDDYSLRKMTTAEYIKDDRFMVFGASYALNGGEIQWADALGVAALVAQTDWANTMLIAHNTAFDGAVLSFFYDVRPAMYGDTLSMARYCFDIPSYSLDNVSKLLDLPPKGDALVDVKGKHELTPAEMDALIDYAKRDTEICQLIFEKLKNSVPPSEFKLIDMTIRMFTYPRLMCDAEMLEEYEQRLRADLADNQLETLVSLAEIIPPDARHLVAGPDVFTSNKRFETLLRTLGVDIPTKLKRATEHQHKLSMNRIEKAKQQITKNNEAMSACDSTIASLMSVLQARELAGKDMDIKAAEEVRARIKRAKDRKPSLARANEALEVIANTAAIKKNQLVEVAALAKNDEGLIELMDHPDEVVTAAVATRVASMSTLNITRAGKLAAVSRVMDGYLPVPLSYCAANTNRWGGREYNMQNLPARGRDKTLRTSLIAPPGYKIIAADLAQIEPRVLAWLAGEEDLLDSFRAGQDFYTTLYTKTFGGDYDEMYAGYKADVFEFVQKRNVGKAQGLGLGFGMGANKFVSFAKTAAKLEMSQEEADDVVEAYRKGVPGIVDFWDNCGAMLSPMATNATLNALKNKCLFRKGFVFLPSGRMLRYDQLRSEEIVELDAEGVVIGKRRAWVYGPNANRRYTYGAKIVENLTQALARDVVADMAIQVSEVLDSALGESIVMLVHDEIVAVIREDRVDYVKEEVKRIMTTTPAYTPGLPVNCSIHVANNYAEAK
jgi:DNA polymerase I-like protein with 3'-5' exonuclease and polymerase domains